MKQSLMENSLKAETENKYALLQMREEERYS
jgi:hypothetical protein